MSLRLVARGSHRARSQWILDSTSGEPDRGPIVSPICENGTPWRAAGFLCVLSYRVCTRTSNYPMLWSILGDGNSVHYT